MSDTQQRLIDCFKTVFPSLTGDEITRASNSSVATWDSLAMVNLIAILEEEFAITIAPEEYEYLVSFELVHQHLEGKIVHA